MIHTTAQQTRRNWLHVTIGMIIILASFGGLAATFIIMTK